MIEIDIEKRIKTYDGSGCLRVKTSFISKGITTIYGPSGAGKTTFLRVLAGLILPEQGTIRVDGETWLDTQAGISLSAQERRTGFVFQDYALFPSMSVLQHLLYGCTDQQYVERLLSIGKMEPFKNHKPAQLSGGQQQRLAILRALSVKPGILLMDEPFSALDTKLKVSFLPDLKQLLTEQEVTCLVVTHYPFETENFAEHSFEFL